MDPDVIDQHIQPPQQLDGAP
eukprot:COSAG05_NODE_23669_length_256_cov_0.745223_1_plen_20_part_10